MLESNHFDNFEFRCSSLGKIVSKSGKLTDGIKTHLQDVFTGYIHEVKKQAFGKALDKGILCEEDTVTMIQKVFFQDKVILKKNTQRKRNGYIHGEWDVFHNGIVFDAKNAWDKYTFGRAELSWDYEWQLVGYTWLLGAQYTVLFYSLNNMPAPMLEAEKTSLYWKNKYKYSSFEDPQYLADCKEFEEKHNYDHMALIERFKFWEVDVTDEKIERLKKAVKDARVYLNELLKEHLDTIEKNMNLMNNGFKSELTPPQIAKEPEFDLTILKKV